MKYFTFKNWNYFIPWFPRFYWNKYDYSWKVIFNNSCKYDHGTDDQLDWNKLVGISNFIDPRKNSLRIVWRYNKEDDLFEIGYYLEKDKEFISGELQSIKSGELLEIRINCYNTYSLIETNKKLEMVDFKQEPLTFRLNPYFGGNLPAPHKMNLQLW